jgi:hypothetical protein
MKRECNATFCATAPADNHRELLIALDFGTTFSGVAWAQTSRVSHLALWKTLRCLKYQQADIQTPIVQWPDANGSSLEGQTSEKVPSQIYYENGECVWGFAIPDEKSRYQWFKLDLDPSHKHRDASLLAIDYPDPKALLPSSSMEMDAVILTRDYLTEIRKHTDKILRRKLGKSVVETTPIRYTITVPAIWSDAAKVQTRACATAAGMGQDIGIVSEPEAAVIYALDSLDPHSLEVGDHFILCDAGGGTVDLISRSYFPLTIAFVQF